MIVPAPAVLTASCMPLPLTALERKILAALALLIVLGLIGMALL